MFIVPLNSSASLFPTNPGSNAEKTSPASGFSEVLGNAVKTLEETQSVSDRDSLELSMGNSDDLHTIQLNTMRATAAVELTTGVVSKAITAYKEITNMQV